MQQQPLSQRGQKRREAILEAATDAFLQHGYEGTTLDMIITQAGGSRRSLYDYFGDKQGLFGAVIRYHADKLVEEIRSIDVTGMSAREGLTMLANNFVFALLELICNHFCGQSFLFISEVQCGTDKKEKLRPLYPGL